MNIRWTLNRLSAMGGREILHRGEDFVRTRLQRAGLGRIKAMAADETRGKPWVTSLPLPEAFAVETYREAADRILSGHFRLFGRREWALGFPPDWNRDPKTGTRAPLDFGKTLNYRDNRLVGDIKYLWEPSRHLELVTLAQAWHLTREPRFAQGCRIVVESWIEQCPYLLGPHWTNSLELGLRLVNWSFAWHLLGGDAAVIFQDSAGKAFKERWLTAVLQQCHFVAGYLSRDSSANNHILGELLGLLIAATTWGCWPPSRQWHAQAFRGFEAEALLQNSPDGVNKEQAIWYHHEVADMMLLAGLTARANGCDFGADYWRRLEAMLEFIASVMDVGGHVPSIGDSDDAVMVRWYPSTDFCVYRSLLATGSVLFERGDFKHKAGVFDDKSRWLLGDAAAAKFAALPADSAGTGLPRTFAHGGYHVIGSDFESAREVRLVVDAAPLGYLSLAAHGHADALSFTLSVAGIPMLIDPGTYCYHTQRRWRDYFKGTSAHNTVRIDRVDQSVSGGNFLWIRHANARCITRESSAGHTRIVAEHDGYLRLNDPVLHRREIVYEEGATTLTVFDDLVCKAEHHVEIFWHFAADCAVTLSDALATATCGDATVEIRWPAGLAARLFRGSEEPCLGWISERLDEKEPCTTLAIAGEVTGSWRGVSTLAIRVGER